MLPEPASDESNKRLTVPLEASVRRRNDCSRLSRGTVFEYFRATVAKEWPRSACGKNYPISINGRVNRVINLNSNDGKVAKMVISIVGNKYCLHKKRRHKSNNIYFIVNLLTMTYQQRCHDHDCLHFSSRDFLLYV